MTKHAKEEEVLLLAAAAKLRDAFREIIPEEEQELWTCPVEVICTVADWLERLGAVTKITVYVEGDS